MVSEKQHPSSGKNRARAFSFVLAAFVCTLAIGFGVFPAYEERKINTPDTTSNNLPFLEELNRQHALNLLFSRSGSLDDAELKIKQSIKARTLHAPSWLALGEIKLRQKNPAEAKAYIDTAVKTAPNRPLILWRASILYMRIGENASGISTLRSYLTTSPEHITTVAPIAARLEPDSNKLLDSLVPSQGPATREKNYFLNQLLIYGSQNKNDELTKACWERIWKNGVDNPSVVKIYLNYLSDNNKTQQLLTVYKQLINDPDQILQNGGFESKLTQDGIGWFNHKQETVITHRDDQHVKEGRYSYRFDFDGQQNVDYHHFEQKVPVQPGRRYHLTGFWKGESISTRSNPYIEVFSLNDKNRPLGNSDAKRGTWDWEPFELDFTTPMDTWYIRIRIRRLQTDALDRLLSGSFWLDGLSLELLPPSS